jgi:urease accessory protein
MFSFLLLQLADSAFPAGGFAHSGGIEAAMQHGDVATPADLQRLAETAVRQAGRASLPFVLAAHASADRLPELDAFIDVVLNQPVSNRASRAQGCAFLGSARQIFGGAPVQSVADRVVRHGLSGHHAPLFGAVLAALDVDADTAARLYLYQAGRTITSAAVRLGLAGMFDSQRVQASLAVLIDDTLERSRHLEVADVAQIAPVLDLFQSTQDRLYSRLFQS